MCLCVFGYERIYPQAIFWHKTLVRDADQHANFHICLWEIIMMVVCQNIALKDILSWISGLQKMGAFSVNHNETSIICELKILSLFSFGSWLVRSDFKYLSWKWLLVQRYKTLHMSSWDFCSILCSVITVNKNWSDFIITADKSRTASVKPCLWHYDLYCK